MSDKLRNAAILPFVLAAASAPAVVPANERAPIVAPLTRSEPSPSNAESAPRIEQPPLFMGGYRLLRQLGAGGMGVVYLAESTQPVARRVALKTMRADSLSPALAEQFAVEQQALASAEHEHVARFFEAGNASDGRPWFAMELVEGEPITEYCDRRELDVEARLELFEEVSRAVEHLHQRGVLHGDLKPENILVRERDGRAVPKIIDLGLARIGAQEFDAASALRGTPAYMAPEQFSLPVVAPDERRDVYALGVVLRELLVGGEPEIAFPTESREVAAPSQYLRALDATEADARARRRGTRASRLGRRLRRSLDGIVARATARTPERRYATAERLADAVANAVQREQRRSRSLRATALGSVAAAIGLASGWLVSML